MNRILLYLIFIMILSAPITTEARANELQTVIIEVEGELEEHREYIYTHHPFIEIVETYSTLFQGFALQGKPEHLMRLEEAEFIKGVHENQTYQTTEIKVRTKDKYKNILAPKTPFTGKNIDVAVIDTGIDYSHPDLVSNYEGGYDVVDLDEDPMETLPEEGMPTNHGTHVAGIIGANGEVTGVAPDASLHAYRALGPGGMGTTLHVLAALEKAVEDEMDVINLSLGNQVNGPDYPTSTAVNKAVELGIPVVIANGNSGPEPWTVGSPATAKNALSVGAMQEPTEIPFLYHAKERKPITLFPMQGSPSWQINRDEKVIDAEQFPEELRGNIALYRRGEVPFQEIALAAQEKGAVAVLIVNNEDGPFQGAVEANSDLEIPVAGLMEEDGEWLFQQHGEYIETIYQAVDTSIADFSSRGPVTVDWQMKPNIIAPGTNIKSTVPGGYEHFSGTSMATPYVTGAIALLKEAYPDWDTETLYSVLQTTAEPLRDEAGNLHAPSIQGHGLIQVDQALEPPTIMYNTSLEGGKISESIERKEFTITIENRTEKEHLFRFSIPKKQPGIDWSLPLAFKIPPGDTKEVTIDLEVASAKLEPGVHEGFLSLTEKTTNETYHLPYLFVNQSADQPKLAGMEFSLKPFSKDTYQYEIYTTEALELITIDLYDPDTLTYQGNVLEIKDPETGANKGEILRYHLPTGNYLGIVTAINPEGEVETEEIPMHIE